MLFRSEIYISHRGMEEVYTQANSQASGDRSTRWQQRASDPDLEAELLARLMMRFGVEEQRARVEAAPAAIERAKLASGTDGAALLQLDEPFDRAWRRVGLALDRVGFTVEDRDRAKGFYFVRYSDPEQDAARRAQNQGFFSRLFSFGNSANAKPEQYRVLVRDNKDTSQVQVLNGDGGREGSDNARRILALRSEEHTSELQSH